MNVISSIKFLRHHFFSEKSQTNPTLLLSIDMSKIVKDIRYYTGRFLMKSYAASK